MILQGTLTGLVSIQDGPWFQRRFCYGDSRALKPSPTQRYWSVMELSEVVLILRVCEEGETGVISLFVDYMFVIVTS